MGKAFLIKKVDGSYLPAFESDQEAMKGVKVGDPIEVSWSQPRNYDNHKRFFAMFACCVDNMPESTPDRYLNLEYLRYEVLIGIGHCELRESMSGQMYPKVKSISFKSMGEDEFNQLYKLTSNYLLKHFLKGLDPKIFELNINLFM